jgi:hypothetical protein
MAHLRSFRWFVQLIVLGLLCIVAPTVRAAPLADGFLSGCTGEYFNNISLSGAPSYVRGDGAINFFWGENVSPAPGINVNNYSVRWSCNISVPSTADYTFNMVADDGMNLIVDGNLILWAWYDQGPTSYSKTVNLGSGTHSVRIEYYNHWNAGTAQVTSNIGGGGSIGSGDWKGEYYNNQSLSGSPTITRNESNINFNWGLGSPDGSIPVDHFSARWSRGLYLTGGTWRFQTTTDDGVRLWVNGNIVIDQWRDQSGVTWTADVTLGTGTHAIVMEFYENVMNAQAVLSYTPISAAPTPVPVPVPIPVPPSPGSMWRASYFTNMTLSGAPAVVRDEPYINYNWYEGAPLPGFQIDYFSVRWDSTQYIAATGNIPITATSDDGVRVWVDGNLVIDGWYDHGPTTFSASPYLGAGAHAFRVEYYDRALGAMIQVQIGSIAPPPGPPPASEVIVDDLGPGWRAGGSSTGWRSVPAGVGGHAFWTYNNAYSAPYYNWARWYPTLGRAGYYEVFAFIPGGVATTLNARYWIYHNNRYDLVPRAQAFFGNQWASLGTHYFNAQGNENVSLADVTMECFLCRTLVYDAIKFSPR